MSNKPSNFWGSLQREPSLLSPKRAKENRPYCHQKEPKRTVPNGSLLLLSLDLMDVLRGADAVELLERG